MNIQRNIYVEKIDALSVEEQPVELVERKGIGDIPIPSATR
ncbi:MAG: hypothetical protein R6U40_10265 [Desulfobacterales bacterium]